MAKQPREEWKVYKNVFDNFTLRILFKLSSKGLFDELKSPIALGKEGNVFTATKKEENGEENTRTKELVCVKIYRLESCDFHRMYEYIATDPRLQVLRNQKRKIIFAWAQREYRNLMKMREIGISCPTPYGFLNNVLVLEFIGTGGTPAQQVRKSPPENPQKFYEDVVKNMRIMYKNKLVHGDLSEYNILNLEEKPVLIDFSQATVKENPRYKEFWDRDLKNISKYFSKLGVKTSVEILRDEITSD